MLILDYVRLQDNILNLLRVADAAEAPKDSQVVVKEVYSRKNSYLIGDTNLKSTFSLIAVQLYLDSITPTGRMTPTLSSIHTLCIPLILFHYSAMN